MVVAAGRKSLLDIFMEELAAKVAGPQVGFKAGVPGVPTQPYMHGPGGLFNVPGVENDVISTRIEPKGLGSALPAFGSIYDAPEYLYITGFEAPTGSNKNAVCDDPMTAGPVKNCAQRAQFGRYEFQTDPLEINRVGLLRNNVEPTTLRLLNDPLVRSLGAMMNPTTGLDANPMQVGAEVLARMLNVGVDFQDLLVRQVWAGNPANNSAGGGYQEFPGLAILVGTNKVDSRTGTPCPTLRSLIINNAYGSVDANGGGTLVSVITQAVRDRKYIADRTNMGTVQWAFAMRQALFWQLTEVWPCAYLTYRCLAQSNTQTQLVIDVNDQIALRDAMRQGTYLLVDGEQIPVLIDDGLIEENNADNAAIGITCFASDIYFLPLTVRGGTPVLYWEYLDYQRGAMIGARDGNYSDGVFWTDGGRFLWGRKPNNSWCVQWFSKTEPRLILLTPHLAFRLQNVQYCPLIHERDAIKTFDYFLDGGVENRPAQPLYSDWAVTVPLA